MLNARATIFANELLVPPTVADTFENFLNLLEDDWEPDISPGTPLGDAAATFWRAEKEYAAERKRAAEGQPYR